MGIQVHFSGFNDWRSRPMPATAERREELKVLIRYFFEESDETDGYRRAPAALDRRGTQASPELVRTLMRELGPVPCQPRPWRAATLADERADQIPDLMRRDFNADAPSSKLVGDITYIHTWAGFPYLATVIDCHTKAAIGWSMADHTKTTPISDANHHCRQQHRTCRGLHISQRPRHAGRFQVVFRQG